jgi:hypothetical protein
MHERPPGSYSRAAVKGLSANSALYLLRREHEPLAGL